MRRPRISQKHIPLLSTVVVWALLYAAGSAMYEGFFSLRVFVNFFADNSFLGIIAVGMTFVILSGSIDLSVGSILALSSILMAVLMHGPRMFHEMDIRDAAGFAAKLQAAEDPLSQFLREQLSPATRQLLDRADENAPRLSRALAADLDRALRRTPHAKLRQLAGNAPLAESEAGARRADANHALLRDTYPGLLRNSKMRHPRLPIPLAVAIVLGTGTLLGLVMGGIIRTFAIPAFIVTLAGLFFARGLALIVREQAQPIMHPFYRFITMWGIDTGTTRVPLAALVFLAVVAAGIYLSSYTRFGRNVYALGGNEEAALLMGLPVGRTKVGVHTLSGFCAALGGIVFTIYSSGGNPAAGVGMELDAIAAVVVGGTLLSGGVGYVFGTLFGVLIFGIIRTGIDFQGTLSTWWTKVAVGVLLLFFILLQKLFARPGLRQQ